MGGIIKNYIFQLIGRRYYIIDILRYARWIFPRFYFYYSIPSRQPVLQPVQKYTPFAKWLPFDDPIFHYNANFSSLKKVAGTISP